MKENVRHYYGEELQSSSDLKTSACCTLESLPSHIRPVLKRIPEEITNKYYGCGSPVPPVLEGARVLDLGCGTGRDSYLLSHFVGEKGMVYGIDMTENQISVAKKYIDRQTKAYAYASPNVRFIHDEIESMEKHIEADSLDVVVSNCVINLVEDKSAVLAQVYRLLKEGGEFYFSDIYADRRLPAEVRNDPAAYGECLGGALYENDFLRIARDIGFRDPRVVTRRIVAVENDRLKELVGDTVSSSVTYRLWKLEELEEDREDYGHTACYLGGCLSYDEGFPFDKEHFFKTNSHQKVCGNVARILSSTRLAKHFHVEGSFSTHYGKFGGGTEEKQTKTEEKPENSCCC